MKKTCCESIRVHSPRPAVSSSYRRTPVSRGSGWISCQARNDGLEREAISGNLLRGSSFLPNRLFVIHMYGSVGGCEASSYPEYTI